MANVSDGGWRAAAGGEGGVIESSQLADAEIRAAFSDFDTLWKSVSQREQGRISQPKMTQIMSLLNLAPDIQEELLYLPEVMQGKAVIHERLLRPLTRELNWRVQRRMWARIKADPRRVHV